MIAINLSFGLETIREVSEAAESANHMPGIHIFSSLFFIQLLPEINRVFPPTIENIP